MSRAPSQPRTVVCLKCGTSFETRHSQGKYCSAECSRLGERDSWNRYGDKNRTERRQYRKSHYEENRVDVIARTAAYQQTEAGKRAARVSVASQKEKYPERFAARMAVKGALKHGRLTKGPCERCGATEKVHGHHADYSKPLKVEWLCPPCHREEHKAMKARQESGIELIDGSVAYVNGVHVMDDDEVAEAIGA